MIDFNSLNCRDVLADDQDFLFDLYVSTRAEELKAWGWEPIQQKVFLQMQFKARTLSYQSDFPTASYQVIQLGDRAVGNITINRTPTEIRLVAIALLPIYQRQGIATHLIQNLLAEAHQSHLPVILQVATRNNIALKLYQKLGFQIVSSTDMYVQMIWSNNMAIG